jgi:hypothetical protein
LAAASSAHAGDIDWANIYETRVGSIPYLLSGDGLCSGALVAPDRILTAWHCVKSVRPVVVEWKDHRETLSASVIYKDKDNDLAILRLSRPVTRSPIPLSSIASPREGLPLATIGHPMGVNLFSRNLETSWVISSGILSKVNDQNFITDMSISPGNSGGPALDAQGNILGVVSRKFAGGLVGDVAFLTSTPSVRRAMTTSAARSEDLSWLEADSSLHLNLFASGLGEFEFRPYDRFTLAYRFDSISEGRFGFSAGFCPELPSPTPLFSWNAGFMFGRDYGGTDSGSRLSPPRHFLGAEVGLLRSVIRLRYTHPIDSRDDGPVFDAGIDVLAFLGF